MLYFGSTPGDFCKGNRIMKNKQAVDDIVVEPTAFNQK